MHSKTMGGVNGMAGVAFAIPFIFFLFIRKPYHFWLIHMHV